MSTVTAGRAPRKSSKAKSKPADVFSLALAINHQVYNVTPIRGVQDPAIVQCWRLEKAGDTEAVYDVAVYRHGRAECSCPDWTTRHHDFNTAGCKHVRACRAMGLIDATDPTARPGPRPSVPDESGPRYPEFDDPAPACCAPAEPAPCLACAPVDPVITRPEPAEPEPAEPEPAEPQPDAAGEPDRIPLGLPPEFDDDDDQADDDDLDVADDDDLDVADGDPGAWADHEPVRLGPAAAPIVVGRPRRTSPDPVDVAWWQGFTTARDEFEIERRDLEYTISRLEAQIADYRAELAAGVC